MMVFLNRFSNSGFFRRGLHLFSLCDQSRRLKVIMDDREIDVSSNLRKEMLGTPVG